MVQRHRMYIGEYHIKDWSGMPIHKDGEWVSFTEYEALESQRDRLAAENAELRRRLDGVVKMLEPGEKPNCMDPKYNPSNRVSIYDVMRMWHEHRSSLYRRACEIAGRTE